MSYRILPADDLPASADRNGMRPGPLYVVTEHQDGRVVVEWHGVDTLRDAAVVLELLERQDAEALEGARYGWQ